MLLNKTERGVLLKKIEKDKERETMFYLKKNRNIV